MKRIIETLTATAVTVARGLMHVTLDNGATFGILPENLRIRQLKSIWKLDILRPAGRGDKRSSKGTYCNTDLRTALWLATCCGVDFVPLEKKVKLPNLEWRRHATFQIRMGDDNSNIETAMIEKYNIVDGLAWVSGWLTHFGYGIATHYAMSDGGENIAVFDSANEVPDCKLTHIQSGYSLTSGSLAALKRMAAELHSKLPKFALTATPLDSVTVSAADIELAKAITE